MRRASIVGDTAPRACTSVSRSAPGKKRQSVSSTFSPPRMPVSQSCTSTTRLPPVSSGAAPAATCPPASATTLLVDLVVQPADARHRAFPRKRLHPFVAAADELGPQGRIADDPFHRIGDGFGIEWIDQDGRLAHHLWQRRNVRRDDRYTGGHGLERREPEAFVKRRKDERRRQTIQHGQHFVADE